MFLTLTVPFILSLLLMTILALIISVYWQVHFYFLANFLMKAMNTISMFT